MLVCTFQKLPRTHTVVYTSMDCKNNFFIPEFCIPQIITNNYKHFISLFHLVYQ